MGKLNYGIKKWEDASDYFQHVRNSRIILPKISSHSLYLEIICDLKPILLSFYKDHKYSITPLIPSSLDWSNSLRVEWPPNRCARYSINREEAP